MAKLVPSNITTKMQAALYSVAVALYEEFRLQVEYLGWELDLTTPEGNSLYWYEVDGEEYYLDVDMESIHLTGDDPEMIGYLKTELWKDPSWIRLKEAVQEWKNPGDCCWDS